jgi:3-oxoacyl-[acyl-carrier protein] reductase
LEKSKHINNNTRTFKMIALITGAAGGLGKAICGKLHKEAYKIIAIDTKEIAFSDDYHYFKVDIRNRDELDVLAAKITCPDLIVNCAGITRDSVCWKMSPEEWQTVIDVNLTGAVNVFTVFAAKMRKRKSGVIINISSINGSRGKFGQSNYVAAKAGLEGLTRTWAIEMGKYGIRVNAVAPGMVETEMTKTLPEEVRNKANSERLLPYAPTPDDIANAVLFLASEQSRCITGQVLNVESGQLTG